MLCKVTHCAGRVSANTRPHQLSWGDREMGTAIICVECSQVAGLIQKVGRDSSKSTVSSYSCPSCMHIMCLTPSTHSWVTSKVNHSGADMQGVSCRLLTVFYVYLWTCSLACCHLLSYESSDMAPRAAHARKVCKLYIKQPKTHCRKTYKHNLRLRPH